MNTRNILLILAVALLPGFAQVPGEPGGQILYNQVGYMNQMPKMLLVPAHVDEVAILDGDGKEVLKVRPAPALFWDASGTSVRKVDFSAITVPGKYTVQAKGIAEKPVINIASKPYHKLTRSVMKAFYLSRLGMPIEEVYAGAWARPAAHPDTTIYIHPSAVGPGRPVGTVIQSPGGWYDAGDYNKYIVNSAITTYTLMKAVEDYPGFYRSLNLNIPESRKGVPDLLAEAVYNYKWMLTMQDPADGGVYHKLTNRQFDGVVMPQHANKERYVVMKSTAAALDFAAVAAHASKTLAPYGKAYPGLAARSLEQAEQAWAWARQHPEVYYKQPEDVKTGEYGDKNLKDEWFWAAAELYLATGKKEYEDAVVTYYQKPATPEWAIVHGLGFMSLLSAYDKLSVSIQKTNLRQDFLSHADELVRASEASSFGVSIRKFVWGSNSYVANEGMLKLFAFQLTSAQKYLSSALSDLDYLMGRNATGYCFVTGYGQKQVMHIHHRPSQADGIVDPWPGFLVGGPNMDTFADCPEDKTRPKLPATSYADMECSYSTNEVAINWNAPMAYLCGGFDAR